jgi:hypothetical protein
VTARGYTLAIDWTKAGTFANANEDVTTDGHVQRGDIDVSWGRAVDGEVTLKSSTGQMSFALNNRDKLYSPENTSGPLYRKILPGLAVQFSKTAPNGAIYTLLRGVIDTFSVATDTARTFSATVLDAWGRPGGEEVSTGLYSGLRTGDAINVVLDAIGWTGPRNIDPGATLIPWWWEDKSDAATAIDRLVASEGPPAIAYVEGGTFVFRDRHHRITNARSQTSQAVFTHIEPAGTGPAGDLKIERGSWMYDHGVRNIVNTARFSVALRTAGTVEEVWASEDPITVASGDAYVVTIEADNPFFYAQTPIVGIDIQLSSGTISGVSLSRTSGQSTVLSFTATTAAVVTRLAIQAVSVKATRTVQVANVDASSVGIFGTQSWPDTDNPVWANRYDTRVVATRVVSLYATYRPVVTFTVYAINDTYLNKLLDLKISDRVTVRHDPAGINRDFMVERIEHRVTDLNQHRVTLTCVATEPTQPTNVFTFDTVGQGFDDGALGMSGIDSATTMFRFDTAGVGFDQGLFAN